MRRCYAALVEWLREILPGKTTAELLIWRLAARNMQNRKLPRIFMLSGAESDEKFIEARYRGMVMLVFCLRGFRPGI